MADQELDVVEKVLVLGASGYIGSAAVDRLEQDYRVLRAGLDSGIEVDITRPDQVRELPDVDAVVNAAGTGDIDGLPLDRYEWDAVNVEGIENLARRYFDTRFVHLSSLAAMGLEGDYNRGEAPSPWLPYSRSKRASEEVVRENFEDYVIVRPATVFDRETPPGLLETASRFGFIPSNGKKTPAIRKEELAEVVAVSIEGRLESPVLAAREYLPRELARGSGLEGLEVPVPDAFLGSVGLLGEMLRKIGLRVPGKIRARSIASDQSVSRQPGTLEVLGK